MTQPGEVLAYWRDRRLLKFYLEDQPYRSEVAERVVAEAPRRVLEFGCNAGRNLLAIRKRAPSIELVGVDINEPSVAYGRTRWGLDLRVGDQSWLESQPDDAFDLAFTVSVLDHIPDAGPVLEQLARVAQTLLLMEPWTGSEGDVRDAGITPNSPSWSWDIPSRLRALGMSVTVRRSPIGNDGMAATYRSYLAKRRDGGPSSPAVEYPVGGRGPERFVPETPEVADG